MPALISVFGVEPRRIGGTETFARELSLQLGERGWQSVLCFLCEPSENVRRFLDLPNISFEVLANSTSGGCWIGETRSHHIARGVVFTTPRLKRAHRGKN